MVLKYPKALMLPLILAAPLANLACAGGQQSASAPGSAAETPANQGNPTESSDKLTLAVKYVAYVNDKNQPAVSQEVAQKDVATMNDIYATCGVQFKMEDYQMVKPSDLGLTYAPSSMSELEPIRSHFDESKYLVVVNTGKWDHSGGLGADGANAWTTMPGQSPSGAVLEQPVADNAPLVAHEIGHYLSLDHTSDQQNLMNPVIYPDTRGLTADQCQSVRDTAKGARAQALR